ncbi:hypothetical protein [Schaalia sp. ZJ1691]|uniref:hypothetical protein n=1 Tax=Schaalia sp. ZJ1691 TaxID=2709404 RepID=UPI0013EB4DAD|nr:hypothetical protein [Schaalia sp. ZJ1691]
MSIVEILTALSGLSGLGGLAAFIGTLANMKKTKEIKADTQQLQSNHGSSIADAIRRIEDSVRSVGHQVGEVRTDLADERRDRRAWDESLSDRVQRLEGRRR